MKRQKGITLIALVITIIVLLILAGVSISAALGNNGILTRAEGAVDTHKRGAVLEAAQLAYNAGMLEKYSNKQNTETIQNLTVAELIKQGYDVKTVSTTTTTVSEVNLSEETLRLSLGGSDGIINITYQTGNDSNSRYFVKIENEYYELTIGKEVTLAEEATEVENLETSVTTQTEVSSSDTAETIIKVVTVGDTITVSPVGVGTATITVTNGSASKTCTVTVPEVVSASGIAPTDYGKQVTGYTLDNYNGTWEILYADDSNIYLITTNAVSDPIYNSNEMSGAVNAGTYATGSSLLITNPTQYPAANKWFRGWLDSSFATAGSTNNNMQATLFMLDSTNVWNGIYRNATYADWAIGGPTYELLAESVNDVQSTTYAPVAESATGYAYGTISSGLTSGTLWNRGEYYWLASPSSYSGENVCFVYYDHGSVYRSHYIFSAFTVGFRPVVCLNSSVQLEEGTDGTTYAIKK